MKATGIVIIIVGIALTAFTTFTYFTREKVVDLGEVEITAKKQHMLNWSPLIGIAVIGIGGVVLLTSKK